MKTKVFIIPGLSDEMRGIGRFIEGGDIITEVFVVGWRKKVQNPRTYFQDRLGALLAKIDTAHAEGFRVVLIGASAGGSFAVNAFSKRESTVAKVINLSGRLTTEEGFTLVSLEKYKETDPVFMASVEMTESYISHPTQSLLQNFVAFVPLWDELVPLKTMGFEGARGRRVIMCEHILNIVSMFTIYRNKLLAEL